MSPGEVAIIGLVVFALYAALIVGAVVLKNGADKS